MVEKTNFYGNSGGAVEPFDRLLPNELRNLGAVSALITDHYHYREPGTGVHGYHENYSFTNLVRGHEYDQASSEPLENLENLTLQVILKPQT